MMASQDLAAYIAHATRHDRQIFVMPPEGRARAEAMEKAAIGMFAAIGLFRIEGQKRLNAFILSIITNEQVPADKAPITREDWKAVCGNSRLSDCVAWMRSQSQKGKDTSRKALLLEARNLFGLTCRDVNKAYQQAFHKKVGRPLKRRKS